MSPARQHAKQDSMNAHWVCTEQAVYIVCARQIKYCWCAASKFSYNSLARFGRRAAERKDMPHANTTCMLLADITYCPNLRSQLMIHNKERTQHAEEGLLA